MTGLTVTAESGETVVFGHTVSDLQTGLEVHGNRITGTLKYCDSGALATEWGAGNFMVLKFSNPDDEATSVKVGMTPSESSGLVELLGDPDMNGVFKVTDKDAQRFTVVSTDGTRYASQYFDLSGLVVETE